MPELEEIHTLGDLFTVQDDVENKLGSIECKYVPFKVNKFVVMTPCFVFETMYAIVMYNGRRYEIYFRQRWEVDLADFLEVDNGRKTVRIDNFPVSFDAYGKITFESLCDIEKRILDEFNKSRELKLKKI